MQDVVVRPVQPDDRTSWCDMRAVLYGEDPSLVPEIEAFFAGHSSLAAVFIAEDGVPVGFVELGLRNYAEGCRTSPVAYVEGLYVAADYRRRKIGQSLIRAAEDWAKGRGSRRTRQRCVDRERHQPCGASVLRLRRGRAYRLLPQGTEVGLSCAESFRLHFSPASSFLTLLLPRLAQD